MPNKMPANHNQIDATARYTVGQVFEGTDSSGRWAAWKYVSFLDAVTYIRGQVLCWGNAAGTAVTNDRAGGTGIGAILQPAGIATAIHTQGSFGFIQISGYALVIGDGSVAAEESVVPHSVDGQMDTMAAGEEHLVFGVALQADDTANDPLTTSAMSLVHLKMMW